MSFLHLSITPVNPVIWYHICNHVVVPAQLVAPSEAEVQKSLYSPRPLAPLLAAGVARYNTPFWPALKGDYVASARQAGPPCRATARNAKARPEPLQLRLAAAARHPYKTLLRQTRLAGLYGRTPLKRARQARLSPAPRPPKEKKQCCGWPAMLQELNYAAAADAVAIRKAPRYISTAPPRPP